MKTKGRKFVVIDKKSFDIVSERCQVEGVRISEHGRGFRVSIALDEEEVMWLMEALEDFY